MDGNERIGERYTEYLAAAAAVQKGVQRAVLPPTIAGLVIGCLGVTSFLWAGYRAAAYGLWLGIIVLWVVAFTVIILASRSRKRELGRVGGGMAGFEEFERLYRRRYWPKSMAAGEKLEKSRSILGGA